MEEIVLELINKTLESFDFPFCIIVNIATYLAIKLYTDYKKKSQISTRNKRFIFLGISIIIAMVYCNVIGILYHKKIHMIIFI